VCIGLEDDPNGNNSIISRSGADIKHKEELEQVQVKQDISYHYIHDMSYILRAIHLESTRETRSSKRECRST